jgi:RNA polymerase sigma factor (sigma-70 family)
MTDLASDRSATTSAVPAATVFERALAGDEIAFSRIVADHHLDLLRVAYVVTGDRQLAEDAAQQAWAIAWRKRRSVRDPARLHGWLVAIAANEARQLIRHRRRGTVAEIRVRPLDGSSPDPSDSIDRVDLVRVLGRLKAEDRSLLALRYAGGLDSAEIGGLLGMTASGVRGHLSRLLGRLRRELDDA